MNNRLNIHKTLETFIGLNIIQVVLILGYIAYSYILKQGSGLSLSTGSFLLIIIILTTLINSIYIIKDSSYVIKYERQYEMLRNTLFQVEELNKTLRAQRHDFMNHLQVVYSLIEMDEFSETKSYVERIYSDIQKVSRSLKTSSPAINALLQAKLLSCEKKGIKVILNICSQLTELPVPAWEMCRVLGNLIDNAIYALNGTEPDNRVLNVEFLEDAAGYTFIIEDNGESIPSENLEEIFKPGFTTKGSKGEGIGLAISREIVETHGGLICVESNIEKTTFTVKIPRHKA